MIINPEPNHPALESYPFPLQPWGIFQSDTFTDWIHRARIGTIQETMILLPFVQRTVPKRSSESTLMSQHQLQPRLRLLPLPLLETTFSRTPFSSYSNQGTCQWPWRTSTLYCQSSPTTLDRQWRSRVNQLQEWHSGQTRMEDNRACLKRDPEACKARWLVLKQNLPELNSRAGPEAED